MTPRRLLIFRLCLTGLMLGVVFGYLLDSAQAAPSHTVTRGVALDDWSHMGDLAVLNAQNFYGWGWYCNGAANCINMDRNWTLPLPACDSTVLLGNEPTTPEPAGHPIDASVAASVTVAIKAQCPNTQIVVANIYMDDSCTLNNDGATIVPCSVNWINAYLAAYQQMSGHAFGGDDRLGVHFYCYDEHSDGNETPFACLNALQALETYVPNLPVLWITETGIPSANYATDWPKWLSDIALDTHVERVYVWTNRDVDCGCDDPMNLVNPDGTLTARGQVYHDWPAQSWQTWAPSVSANGYP